MDSLGDKITCYGKNEKRDKTNSHYNETTLTQITH